MTALVCLSACLFAVSLVLSGAMVVAIVSLRKLMGKCIDHALAESVNQREISRMRFEAEHQEFLLREAREKARREMRDPTPRPNYPEGEPEIMVATGNGNMD